MDINCGSLAQKVTEENNADWLSWQRMRWQTGTADGREDSGRLAKQVAKMKMAAWPSMWQRVRWQAIPALGRG